MKSEWTRTPALIPGLRVVGMGTDIQRELSEILAHRAAVEINAVDFFYDVKFIFGHTWSLFLDLLYYFFDFCLNLFLTFLLRCR